MGDGEIVSGSSFRECVKPLWAGTDSERSYLALALLSQSSLSPSPTFYQPRCLCSYMWIGQLIQLKTGKKTRLLIWLVPLAGLPCCCTNSSHREGVVMNCNQSSYGRFFFFIFLHISKLLHLEFSEKAECQAQWLCWFSSATSEQAVSFLCCFSWPAASRFQMCALLLCWILESHLRIVLLSLQLWLL